MVPCTADFVAPLFGAAGGSANYTLSPVSLRFTQAPASSRVVKVGGATRVSHGPNPASRCQCPLYSE